MSKLRRPTEVLCEVCGKPRTLKLAPGDRPSTTCRSCSNIHEGRDNNQWKGGHRHWSPGRYGRDKDGLSWKVQRRLAWERDGFTCQHCHTKGHRNPDVHHISPFRVSLSHALDNLICLCQKCHLTEEAKVQDHWGGQLVVPRPPKVDTRPRCGCGSLRVSGTLQLCWDCWRPILRADMQRGLPMKTLPHLYGLTYSSIDGILFPRRASTRQRLGYEVRATSKAVTTDP